MVNPIIPDHQMKDAVEQSDISPWLYRKEKVTGPPDRSNSGIDDNHFGTAFTGLPDVVGRDRSTFGNIRAANPDDFRLQDVVPWIGRSIDTERLLICGPRAHHAKPAIVVRIRRLQTDASELSHEITLLGRQTRSAQTRKCRCPVSVLDATDLFGNLSDSLLIGYSTKPVRIFQVPFIGVQQTIRMRALQITFHSFRAQFAFVEREFVPSFISNYLIVLYQEMDPALLAAKTAVCIYYFVRHNAGVQSPTSRPRKMRAELFSDRFRLYAKSQERMS